MDTKWFEDFISLVEHGTFTKAAEMRFVTQPAFSRRIRALENWLGIILIDRNAYPAKLTSEALMLVEDIEFILERLKALQQTAKASGHHQNALTLATQHSLSISICPRWFNQVKPLMESEGSIRINAGNLYDSVDQFLAGAADLLMCYNSNLTEATIDKNGLDSLSLGCDYLIPVYATAHADLVFQPDEKFKPTISVVAFPEDSFFGRVIETALRDEMVSLPFKQKITMVTALSDSALALVLQGEGIAWLPKSLVQQELDTNVLVVLPGDHKIPIDIRVYFRQSDLRPIIQSIKDHTTPLL